jgi:hypothetical protein
VVVGLVALGCPSSDPAHTGGTSVADSSTTTDQGGGGTIGETRGRDESPTDPTTDDASSGPPQIECGDATPGEAVEATAIVAIDCEIGQRCTADDDAMAAATFAGDEAFTIVAEVALLQRPSTTAAIVSRWDLDDQRSFELGVEPGQQPYLWLSRDGKYEASTETLAKGDSQLRVRGTYEVAAVVEPGVGIAMYVDGVLVREQADVVDSLFGGSSELAIGRRADDADGPLDDAVGRVRIFDRALGGQEIADLAVAHDRCSTPPTLPEIIPLTEGPRFHWFSYYDKFQFDPSDRFVLGMSIDFEDRAITADDIVELGMVDLDNDNEWIVIGESNAFNWQQGCMLQWLPGSSSEVIYNDRELSPSPHYVSRVLDVETGATRTLSRAIFTVSPDGATGLGIDFERYDDMVAGYGYPGIADPQATVDAPEDMGIYAVDTTTGESSLIVSYAEAAAFPTEVEGKHHFYAVRANPSGTRFVFYDRILPKGGGYPHTRVFMADMDGTDLSLADDIGDASHIDWLDDQHVVLFSSRYDGYATIHDGIGHVGNVLDYPVNGHQLFLPGAEWMVSDTYPDVFRQQHPFLYHLPGGEIYALAHMHSPESYQGSDRCDNHPRISRDGRKIVVDSAMQGGRQMYMFEIGEILDEGEARVATRRGLRPE